MEIKTHHKQQRQLHLYDEMNIVFTPCLVGKWSCRTQNVAQGGLNEDKKQGSKAHHV